MKPREARILPVLPEGIKVNDKPAGLEFLQRGNERWMLVIQSLNALDATKCLEINISGITKNKINGIKNSIKHAGVKLGHKGKIKFATKADTLYIWSNK